MKFILALFTFIVAGVVLFFVGLVFDQTCLSVKEGDGKVIEKKDNAAWVQPIIIGKVTTVMYHPESWSLLVQMDNWQGWVNVNREKFDLASNGKLAHIKYVSGRFSNRNYIKEVSF
jgi:hypothetical protein